jgi:hypothetical protein
MIGLVAIKLVLRGIVHSAVGLGLTAILLARRGTRQNSVRSVRAAAYLAAVADWLLNKRG